jgi:hypothetical protein
MTVIRAAVVGTLSVGGSFAYSAIAAAEPAPQLPDDPAASASPQSPTPPAATIDAPLAQNGSAAAGPGGIPDLMGSGAADLLGLLGQTARPAAPGGDVSTPPVANALNNAYLLPQNIVPSAPGQGTAVGVAPGQENADISGIDYVQRLYATYQQGGLTGAMLGQRSQDQLGEPLPGTAPPPGTPIPPGLGQNLPDQRPPPAAAGR